MTTKLPLLLFDDDCGLCTRWVSSWRKASKGRVDLVPLQQSKKRGVKMTLKELKQSIHLYVSSDEYYVAAEAILRFYALIGRRKYLLWCYRYLPGFALLSEAIYRLVAANRHRFAKDKHCHNP